MKLNQGWVGTDLGRYRECPSTYGAFPIESLPPLPTERFDGTFAWLAEAPVGGLTSDDEDEEYDIEYLEPIDGAPLERLGSDLPASFTAFMRRPELLSAVPSCTACWWDLTPAVTPSPLGDGARLVRFLNDQQGCCFWYLYLLPDGGHRVVCGVEQYDAYEVDADSAAADLVVVAPDFESFVYRFWVENLTWFEVVRANRSWDELSEPVRAYLGPYREARDAAATS
ncbi:hypothetical protein AB0J86_15210 [Micromonospora sp. NPDC049559]|uniref:hypothetical protein n=1 Tax=Micromonospora sp. NPDC049559 TaxID=3155923 RepID=UPI003427CC13